MKIRSILLLLTLFASLSLPSLAETCWLCKREPFSGELKTFHYTESGSVVHSICPSCIKKNPSCSICTGITKTKVERDGRFICPDCKKVAVDSSQEIQALYSDVQRFTKKLLKKTVDSPPPVSLVENDEMLTRYHESSSRSLVPHAFYRPYNPEIIYVLSGHSKRDLGPTLAHEFTHSWQSRHCPQQDRQVKEGFATWVGYKYALARGYRREASALKRRRDHDYGQGLRHCLAIEKKKGVKGLLEFVTTETKF